MAGHRTVTRSGQKAVSTANSATQQQSSQRASRANGGQEKGTRAKRGETRGGQLVPSLVLPIPTPTARTQHRAQQQARRRRQAARHVRRFEAMMSWIQRANPGLRGLSLPSLQLSRRHPSRIFSLLLLLAALGTIAWVHYDPAWYVYQEYVTFENLTYTEAATLYPQIEVEGWNVFWISPARVREALVALPTIADAKVYVRPPHWVTIDVQEAEPIARWVTQEGDFWLLPDGTALARIDERYDMLPQIVDNLREASIWGDPTQQQIDPDILQSALALLQLLPEIQSLYYHADVGLNFHMADENAWVYWGDGSAMEQKYSNLVAVRQLLQAEPQPINVVDVRSERPVLR